MTSLMQAAIDHDTHTAGLKNIVRARRLARTAMESKFHNFFLPFPYPKRSRMNLSGNLYFLYCYSRAYLKTIPARVAGYFRGAQGATKEA
jgi:hypothetical protein